MRTDKSARLPKALELLDPSTQIITGFAGKDILHLPNAPLAQFGFEEGLHSALARPCLP